MKIAIASGKGGTGKTTVAVNFAYLASKSQEEVYLVDCDVEEPNCHLFIKPVIDNSQLANKLIPAVNSEKCVGCGECVRFCNFNALAIVKNKVFVFPELCHSCGGCTLVCQEKTISEANQAVGNIESGSNDFLKFVYGKLHIGQAISPPLIKQVKNNFVEAQLTIFDCPPGTSCPVVASVEGVDFVILVTEATPFGLYDLKLAVEMLEKLKIPHGIVLNRSDKNDFLIENYAQEKSIEILSKIPLNKTIAEVYSRGKILLECNPEFEIYFEPLLKILQRGNEK